MTEKKEEKNSIGKSLGVAGFTLGITSLVLIFFNFLAGFLAALVGLIFCTIQQKKNPSKKGKMGLIISIIGLIINVASFIYYVIYLVPMLSEIAQGM